MSDQSPDLIGRFTRLARLFHRLHHHNFHAHGLMGDIHRGQGRVLALLKMKPEISQKDLSFLLDMRAQSLGELLAKLERGGYITRTPSEADRRVLNIRLTDAGVAAANRQGPAEEADAALFANLSDEEQVRLCEYLDRVIATLEERFGGDREETAFFRRGRGCGREDCPGHGPRHGHDREHRHHHGHRHHGRPPFRGRDDERLEDGRERGPHGEEE